MKEKMKKFKEFWIDPDRLDYDCHVHDAYERHPKQGPLFWQQSLIKVIEYKGFEHSQKLIQQLKSALQNFENDDGHVPETIWNERNEALKAVKEWENK